MRLPEESRWLNPKEVTRKNTDMDFLNLHPDFRKAIMRLRLGEPTKRKLPWHRMMIAVRLYAISVLRSLLVLIVFVLVFYVLSSNITNTFARLSSGC